MEWTTLSINDYQGLLQPLSELPTGLVTQLEKEGEHIKNPKKAYLMAVYLTTGRDVRFHPGFYRGVSNKGELMITDFPRKEETTTPDILELLREGWQRESLLRIEPKQLIAVYCKGINPLFVGKTDWKSYLL